MCCEPVGGRCGGSALLLLGLLVAACTPSGDDSGNGVGSANAEASPPRAGRFGSLRDFVLVDRGDLLDPGVERYLLVDRFEVTRGDWVEFARTAAGSAVDAADAAMTGESALPVGRVSLRQARAFARWRFARLPTRDEWMAVAYGEGRFRYPWGNFVSATRANTAELGLRMPSLVGTFESGERGEPYDLIGNVSEWTETVSPQWSEWDRPGQPQLSLPVADGHAKALAATGLAVWQIAPGLVAPVTIVAADPDRVPRDVVGSDFQSRIHVRVWTRDPRELRQSTRDLVEPVLAGDRRERTGLRLLTTPVELLRALASSPATPSRRDLLQLRLFVERRGHLPALRAAWPAAIADLIDLDRPLASWLQQHLE